VKKRRHKKYEWYQKFVSELWQVTFRLTATLRQLELSSLGKIENVLKTELQASRKPAMLAVELL
jgi:hypothetical protein